MSELRNAVRWFMFGFGTWFLIICGGNLFGMYDPTPPQIPLALGMMAAIYAMVVWWLTEPDLLTRLMELLRRFMRACAPKETK